jgi:sialidase-1
MGRDTNESMCVELDDGRLMANMRSTKLKQRVVSVSDDQGNTWQPMSDDQILIGPQCQASLIRYSSLANGDDKNRLLFSNPASTKREMMTVRLSYDEGKTWPVSKLIYLGKAAYSSLTVLPDGSVGMLYENGPQHDTDQLTFVRFTIEWLTDGKDRGLKKD